MDDTELLRFIPILEKLANAEDVRKVLRRLVANNEIDPVAEQQFLSSSTKRETTSCDPRLVETRKRNTGLKNSQEYD